MSTNTIQRINNSSAKSTTKSEPGQRTPSVARLGCKITVKLCPFSEDLDKIPSDCKIQ